MMVLSSLGVLCLPPHLFICPTKDTNASLDVFYHECVKRYNGFLFLFNAQRCCQYFTMDFILKIFLTIQEFRTISRAYCGVSKCLGVLIAVLVLTVSLQSNMRNSGHLSQTNKTKDSFKKEEIKFNKQIKEKFKSKGDVNKKKKHAVFLPLNGCVRFHS